MSHNHIYIYIIDIAVMFGEMLVGIQYQGSYEWLFQFEHQLCIATGSIRKICKQPIYMWYILM